MGTEIRRPGNPARLVAGKLHVCACGCQQENFWHLASKKRMGGAPLKDAPPVAEGGAAGLERAQEVENVLLVGGGESIEALDGSAGLPDGSGWS